MSGEARVGESFGAAASRPDLHGGPSEVACREGRPETAAEPAVAGYHYSFEWDTGIADPADE